MDGLILYKVPMVGSEVPKIINIRHIREVYYTYWALLKRFLFKSICRLFNLVHMQTMRRKNVRTFLGAHTNQIALTRLDATLVCVCEETQILV